jgi:hypothetical protein
MLRHETIHVVSWWQKSIRHYHIRPRWLEPHILVRRVVIRLQWCCGLSRMSSVPRLIVPHWYIRCGSSDPRRQRCTSGSVTRTQIAEEIAVEVGFYVVSTTSEFEYGASVRTTNNESIQHDH